MNARLLTSIEQFEPWSGPYERLLEKVGGMERLYYAAEHLRLPVGVFARFGIKPFVILVEQDGEIEALLPFQIQNDWPFGLWKTIRFVGDVYEQMGNCYPCILSDGFRPEAIDAAVELLNTELVRRWDTMDLSSMRTDDENLRYFISRFEEVYECPSEEEFYYFDASAGLDAVLGARKLANIRRCLRRLKEDSGNAEIVVKEDVSDADLEEIAALHSIRQSGKDDGDAFFNSKLIGPLVRGMINLVREQGFMRYYSLRVDDAAIAMAVMIHSDTVSYGFLTAFDPQYKKYSPSRILMYNLFLREFEQYGILRIDTSWGVNKLKLDFSSGSHKLYDVEIIGARRKSKAVHNLSHRLEHLGHIVRRRLRPLKNALRRR